MIEKHVIHIQDILSNKLLPFFYHNRLLTNSKGYLLFNIFSCRDKRDIWPIVEFIKEIRVTQISNPQLKFLNKDWYVCIINVYVMFSEFLKKIRIEKRYLRKSNICKSVL